MLVVDASAALQAASSRGGFGRLVVHQPVAPPLMWPEAFSALHEVYWRREITRELTATIRGRLSAAPIEQRDHPDLHHEAWEVAELLGWAEVYDAEYVALARLLNCRLLTEDQRLRRGAGR